MWTGLSKIIRQVEERVDYTCSLHLFLFCQSYVCFLSIAKDTLFCWIIIHDISFMSIGILLRKVLDESRLFRNFAR